VLIDITFSPQAVQPVSTPSLLCTVFEMKIFIFICGLLVSLAHSFSLDEVEWTPVEPRLLESASVSANAKNSNVSNSMPLDLGLSLFKRQSCRPGRTSTFSSTKLKEISTELNSYRNSLSWTLLPGRFPDLLYQHERLLSGQ